MKATVVVAGGDQGWVQLFEQDLTDLVNGISPSLCKRECEANATDALKESQKVVSNANANENPIIFEELTLSIFVEFLHYSDYIKKQNFLSKSGCGSYRSALKELYRQCGEK